MNLITIRHLEPADIPQVHALYAETQAFSSTLQLPYQSVEHWHRKLDCSAPGTTCLVAVRGEEVVGQLTLQVFQNARRRHAATLGMGVKATARNAGVGSALLAAAIDVCDNWANVCRMEVEVYTDNGPAIALYAKHGFVIEGTCRDYAFRNGRYVDAHVMARVTSGRPVRDTAPPGG